MKFWRQILLTTLVFLSVASITLYTSCEKDPCSGSICQNSGTCVSGVCQCALGYEDPKCGTRSVDRYLGSYYGTTTAGYNTQTGAGTLHLLDTFVVSLGSNLTTVNVTMRAFSPDAVTGTILQDQSGYHIIVPAINRTNPNLSETVKIDLFDNIDPKGDKRLIVYRTVVTDTTAQYQFIGTNQ